MSTIGNVIWIIFGGLFLALWYFVAGTLLCFTIVGIPFGYQAIKIGILALLPFGRTTVSDPKSSDFLSIFMNVLWLLIGGIWISLGHLILGAFFCITIIGIPFGLQHFKLMKVALTPFGRDILLTNPN